MNKTILMGRLTRDPIIRSMQNGGDEDGIVANFRMAVDRPWKKRDEDENAVRADFFNCTAFGRKAKFVREFLCKGSKIAVEGSMRNNNYTNDHGEKIYDMCLVVTDIEFAESKQESDNRRAGQESAEQTQEPRGRTSAGRNQGSSGNRNSQGSRRGAEDTGRNQTGRGRAAGQNAPSGGSRNSSRSGNPSRTQNNSAYRSSGRSNPDEQFEQMQEEDYAFT